MVIDLDESYMIILSTVEIFITGYFCMVNFLKKHLLLLIFIK